MMTKKFALAYIYASPEDLERMKQFRALSGDSEKTLVTQYLRGFIGRNRDYFETLARIDAKAREMSFSDWGRIVVNSGVDSLPGYKHEIKDIPPNPLASVQLTPNVARRTLNYITLGIQNTAFLKVGIHYDRDSAIGYISRIVKEHLDRNWSELYESQVKAENFENWKELAV